MLQAASPGHCVSDNSVVNLGRQHADIKIIDAGSRAVIPLSMTKGEFNKTCLTNFWSKVKLLGHWQHLATCHAAWRNALDMDDARKALDTLWDSMHSSLNSLHSSPRKFFPCGRIVGLRLHGVIGLARAQFFSGAICRRASFRAKPPGHTTKTMSHSAQM